MSDGKEESSATPAREETETSVGGVGPPETRISALEKQVTDMAQALGGLRSLLEDQQGVRVSEGVRLPGPVRVQTGSDNGPTPGEDPGESVSLGGSLRGPQENTILHEGLQDGIGARFHQNAGPEVPVGGAFTGGIPAPLDPFGRGPEDTRSIFSLGQRRAGVQALKTPTLTMSTFTGKNFSLWKRDVMFIMKLNGHWDVISGVFLRPRRDMRGHIFLGPDFRQFGVEEDIETWDALNAQACALLYSALGPEQKQLVSETSEASEMWRILESTYLRKSHAHMAHVLKSYNSCKMKKSQTMQSYIMEVQTHLAQLREIGVQMDEKVTVLNLLNGLREEFILDRKIMSRIDDLTFDEAVGQLLSESLATETGGQGSGVPVGNLAQGANSGRRGGRGGRGRGRGRKGGSEATSRTCYACGDRGHLSSSCPKRDKSHGAEEGLCFVCNKPGHRAFGCPKKVKPAQGGAANLTSGGSGGAGGAPTPSS